MWPKKNYKNYIWSLDKIREPNTYADAAKDINWVDAMQIEIKSREKNKTWTLVSLPPGKHAISCKWVYNRKQNSDGFIERYKANLLAKGFNQ